MIVPRGVAMLIDFDLVEPNEVKLFYLYYSPLAVACYWLFLRSLVSPIVLDAYGLIIELLKDLGILPFRKVEEKSSILVLFEWN